MEKRIFFILPSLIVFLFVIPIVFAGCPGVKDAKVRVDYSLSQPIECVDLNIGTLCGSLDRIYLTLVNKCEKMIIYTFVNGTPVYLAPYDDGILIPGTPFYIRDEVDTSDIGEEWTREFYFEDNPEEKIIISAKNLRNWNGYATSKNIIYASSIILLIIISLLITIKYKKKNFKHNK